MSIVNPEQVYCNGVKPRKGWLWWSKPQNVFIVMEWNPGRADYDGNPKHVYFTGVNPRTCLWWCSEAQKVFIVMKYNTCLWIYSKFSTRFINLRHMIEWSASDFVIFSVKYIVFCYNGNFVQPKENILMFYFTMCNKPRALNPSTAKLCNLNFHPLEVVSRWRDPQLQVSENYSAWTKWRSTLFKSCWLISHFIFNIFKMWYLMCK